VTTDEVYYLFLICSSTFAALGLGLAIVKIQYWRSSRDWPPSPIYDISACRR